MRKIIQSRPPCLPSGSGDNDVWRGVEDGHSGQDGEDRVRYQAESVYHHGSKSPIILHVPVIVVLSDLISDDLDLLQDETQFPVERMDLSFLY